MNININIRYKTSILFFRNSPLWGGFCSFACCSPVVRPPLALVGDGHPNSHETDANAG